MDRKKTPDYTMGAIKKYQSKFDRVNINLPKGSAEKIRQSGESVNGLINRLVSEYLESIDNQ